MICSPKNQDPYGTWTDRSSPCLGFTPPFPSLTIFLDYSSNSSTPLHSRPTQATQLLIARPIRFLLIKQIGPGTAEIYNLGTTVAVLLEASALEAVEGVADPLAAAHDALILVVTEAALVADAYQGRWAHVAVAHRTLAVAFVAEPADGDAGLFAAHY